MDKQMLLTLPPGSGDIEDLAWSPDEKKLAAVTSRGWLHIWYTSTGVRLFHQRLSRSHLLTVAWTRRGRALAVGGEDGALYYIQRLSNPLVSKYLFADPITQLAWSSSPLERCLVVSGEWLTILDRRGQETLMQYQAPILGAAWAADGRTLAVVCGAGLVDVWDADQHLCKFSSTAIVDPQCLAWRQDGRRLAIGTRSGHIYLCDPQAGSIGEARPVSSFPIQALEWGAYYLVAGGEQGDLALWSEQQQLASLQQSIMTFGLNPQGTRLATARLGGVALASL
ncbi:MAG TPA: WD40 repeat domain-containing protein [Ktedonobacteraceae bacterium]|nr:WD40 repeat domain-containing protein [Ktedonobacteraceae bacterium]